MSRHNDQISEINIAPLTDIFLVLLIVMMVVSPTTDFSGLNLEVLPVSDSAAQQPDQKPKVLKIDVNERGEFYLSDKLLERPYLTETIKNRAPENPDGVIIEVNPDAPHEALTFALSAVVQAQITKVAVMQKGGMGGAAEGESAEAAPPAKTKSRR